MTTENSELNIYKEKFLIEMKCNKYTYRVVTLQLERNITSLLSRADNNLPS